MKKKIIGLAIGALLFALCFSAEAQQPKKVHRIGYLGQEPTLESTRYEAFRAGLREKLIKFGAKVVSHGRYVMFQMTEVGVPQQMVVEILSLIARLRAPAAPA